MFHESIGSNKQGERDSELMLLNSFQSSVAFHIETSHLISTTDQITSFYIEMQRCTEMN